MPSFSDALNRGMETIKRPPPLPLGHYVMRVSKMPDPAEELKSEKGNYEKLTIPVQVVSASDDVDPDDLAAFGNVAGTNMRIDFIFNSDDEQKFEGSMNRLKAFIGHCGVDAEQGVLGEKLSEIVNAQFLGEVKHRADPNDPTVLYNEVGRTTSL